jgi:hypothetical protein
MLERLAEDKKKDEHSRNADVARIALGGKRLAERQLSEALEQNRQLKETLRGYKRQVEQRTMGHLVASTEEGSVDQERFELETATVDTILKSWTRIEEGLLNIYYPNASGITMTEEQWEKVEPVLRSPLNQDEQSLIPEKEIWFSVSIELMLKALLVSFAFRHANIPNFDPTECIEYYLWKRRHARRK